MRAGGARGERGGWKRYGRIVRIKEGRISEHKVIQMIINTGDLNLQEDNECSWSNYQKY